MKKHIKKTELTFHKKAIIELNENELQRIYGGTSIDWPSSGCLCTWITREINKL